MSTKILIERIVYVQRPLLAGYLVFLKL